VRVEKIDATANAVTVTGTIRGVTSSIPMTSQYESREFFAESLTSWRPAADHRTTASQDARYVSVLIYSGGAYPARPSGVPGGNVKYVGPVQPTTWLTGDEWVDNS
jgi:hypothetical protein